MRFGDVMKYRLWMCYVFFLIAARICNKGTHI